MARDYISSLSSAPGGGVGNFLSGVQQAHQRNVNKAKIALEQSRILLEHRALRLRQQQAQMEDATRRIKQKNDFAIARGSLALEERKLDAQNKRHAEEEANKNARAEETIRQQALELGIDVAQFDASFDLSTKEHERKAKADTEDQKHNLIMERQGARRVSFQEDAAAALAKQREAAAEKYTAQTEDIKNPSPERMHSSEWRSLEDSTRVWFPTSTWAQKVAEPPIGKSSRDYNAVGGINRYIAYRMQAAKQILQARPDLAGGMQLSTLQRDTSREVRRELLEAGALSDSGGIDHTILNEYFRSKGFLD